MFTWLTETPNHPRSPISSSTTLRRPRTKPLSNPEKKHSKQLLSKLRHLILLRTYLRLDWDFFWPHIPRNKAPGVCVLLPVLFSFFPSTSPSGTSLSPRQYIIFIHTRIQDCEYCIYMYVPKYASELLTELFVCPRSERRLQDFFSYGSCILTMADGWEERALLARHFRFNFGPRRRESYWEWSDFWVDIILIWLGGFAYS